MLNGRYPGEDTIRKMSFDAALGYLDWFDETCKLLWTSDIRKLKKEVRLLETFYLYAGKCRKRKNYVKCDEEDMGNTNSDSLRCTIISFRIKDLVRSKLQDLHSAIDSDGSDIRSKLTRFREDIKLFFETEIKELCTNIVLDYYSIGDPRRVMDFIYSLAKNLDDLWREEPGCGEALYNLLPILGDKLVFLRTFIHFVTLRVEGRELIDLLIHVVVVAVNAARLISLCWFDGDDEQVRNEIVFEISQLVHKRINPVAPQVRETYIHVLTASKLSKSSYHLAMEEDEDLLADFTDCLLDDLMDRLESYLTFTVLVQDQMLKLHEGVRFLSILLRQQEKFKDLHVEMKHLIGAVICDAGIFIFSLSVNELQEGFAKETDLVLSHLLKVLELIMAEAAQIYPRKSASSSGFLRTKKSGSIDFLLENLEELACSEVDSSAFPKDQIYRVQEDIVFLRSNLGNIKEQSKQNVKLQVLWSRFMEVAYKAELVIDSTMAGGKHEYSLDAVARDINLMKIEVLEINDSIRYDSETQTSTKSSIHMPSQVTVTISNEDLVGLNDEVETIVDRLVRGSLQLDVVPVVGMPGLGKTTIANTVYHYPLVRLHFHVRAWSTVSQVYSKHNLLVQILCSIVSGTPDQYLKMNDDDLAEKLYRLLKGNRYLIVLDDVWDIEVWNLLKNSLADEVNGSRILFTSRFQILCSQFKPDTKPHHLRPLTHEESWELLQNKLFGKGGCPPTLSEIGLRIARNCKGLPLTVVLVAGILATAKEDCWEEVANSLSSSSVIETEHCMKTLEVSYNYLPDHLKPCFLYFAAFQEDQDIPVRKLKLLWISERFVKKAELKSLEDVADNYLMDLISRSLVMVSQQRSVGGVKSCRIHDLLHEFCMAKAKEECFLQILAGYRELYTYAEFYNRERLCVYPTVTEELESTLFLPRVRTLLLFAPRGLTSVEDRYLFSFQMYKLLRVLDFGNILLGIAYFPREVELLVHLRYLAIMCRISSIPSSIANLSKLETFIIVGSNQNVRLPDTIWSMKKLRHLCMTSSQYGFSLPTDNLEVSPGLLHLQSLSLAIDASSESLQMILRKLPSLCRLKCRCKVSRKSARNFYGILELDFLSQLESLKLIHYWEKVGFPLNLKKLTLSKSEIQQSCSIISAIGKLPNLEVLKLLQRAFVGETWEMKEGEFPKLRFLKLEHLDILRWTASCDNFPPLQKLILHRCVKLKEVPPHLGDIPTIEMIEVRGCHKSAVSLVKQIREQQMDMGNECLNIIIEEED